MPKESTALSHDYRNFRNPGGRDLRFIMRQLRDKGLDAHSIIRHNKTQEGQILDGTKRFGLLPLKPHISPQFNGGKQQQTLPNEDNSVEC